jgi:phosphatidylinositol-3-phosphatase
MSKAIGVSLFALLVATSAQAQQIGDVFYIALENHNFTQPSTVPAGTPDQLLGNPAAPFLNSLVTPGNPNAADVSYASNYQNVSPTQHPSEPNYVYQVSGLTGPLNDNDPIPTTSSTPRTLDNSWRQRAKLGGRTRRTPTF